MRIKHEGKKMSVSEIPELSVVNSGSFRQEVQAAMPDELSTIEIDLSQTRFVDSCGLGALFALYNSAGPDTRGVTLRLLNPSPPVQQLFELTQMHQLFEIIRR
jgi:anti-sigma B factor antagonist